MRNTISLPVLLGVSPIVSREHLVGNVLCIVKDRVDRRLAGSRMFHYLGGKAAVSASLKRPQSGYCNL